MELAATVKCTGISREAVHASRLYMGKSCANKRRAAAAHLLLRQIALQTRVLIKGSKVTP